MADQVLFCPIAASLINATSIVAAVPGKRIFVIGYRLSASAAVNANFQSHTTTTRAGGLHYLSAASPASVMASPFGIFATMPGEALDINLSAAVPVGGDLVYTISGGWPTISMSQ